MKYLRGMFFVTNSLLKSIHFEYFLINRHPDPKMDTCHVLPVKFVNFWEPTAISRLNLMKAFI